MIEFIKNRAKRCPLCGSKEIYIERSTFGRTFTIYIACADCGLRGYKTFLDTVSIDDGIQRTIEYWNNRGNATAESEVTK